MAKHDELPVYKASYDLLLEIFLFVKDFRRDYKYTVGENLKKETLDLITLIYRANSKTDKREALQLPLTPRPAERDCGEHACILQGGGR